MQSLGFKPRPLSDFDFGRRQDAAVYAIAEMRELHIDGPPTMVHQSSAERGRPPGVTQEADLRRIETGWHHDGTLFLARQDGFEFEVVFDDLPAPSMHVADGCANFGIPIAVERFPEEVDETTVALQERQKCKRTFATQIRFLGIAAPGARCPRLRDGTGHGPSFTWSCK